MEEEPSQRHTLKNKEMDNNTLTIICFIFTTLMAIASIYMYRSIKRKEDEGLDVVPPSKAIIPGGIFMAFMSLLLFIMLLGLGNSPS